MLGTRERGNVETLETVETWKCWECWKRQETAKVPAKQPRRSQLQKAGGFCQHRKSHGVRQTEQPQSIGLVVSLCHGNLTIPAITVGNGTVATTLLTNKRFLNLATKLVKEPTEPLAKKLADIVKENTGMTIQALQKAVRDDRED